VSNTHTAIGGAYDWLEVDSPERDAWLSTQVVATEAYFRNSKRREEIRRRLLKYWDRPREGLPFDYDQWQYFLYNSGLSGHAQVCRRRRFENESEVVLDPNCWPEHWSLANFRVSPDERHIAYAMSERGSDWTHWRVKEIDTGALLDDVIRDTKLSGVTWLPDGAGFVYGRFARVDPGESHPRHDPGQKLYYHKLGDDQTADRFIFDVGRDGWWLLSTDPTDDRQSLVIVAREPNQCESRVYLSEIRPIAEAGRDGAVATPGELFRIPDVKCSFIGQLSGRLLFQTTFEAIGGRVVAVDPRNAHPSTWETLFTADGGIIASARLVGGRLVIVTTVDGIQRLLVQPLDGTPQREVELPIVGAIGTMGLRDTQDLYVQLRGFAQPATIYYCNLTTWELRPFREHGLRADLERYQTVRRWCTSADGTRVPMFVTSRETCRKADIPVLMYAYGSHGVSVTPSFSLGTLLWLQLGGAYVVPAVRGGGELGKKWHLAAVGRNKERSIDDFIAAAQWLVDEGFTRPGRIVALGGSAGGLLVAAAMTRRPELFGACVVNNAVLDMLKYEDLGVGPAWVSEYGTAADPEDRIVLRRYSPLHNVEPGRKYCPVMAATALHDERVSSAHSYKFVAALQDRSDGGPFLLRIDRFAGHRHIASPLDARLERLTDQLTFLTECLNLDFPAVQR
jgi:prolyl oligopeptidase